MRNNREEWELGGRGKGEEVGRGKLGKILFQEMFSENMTYKKLSYYNKFVAPVSLFGKEKTKILWFAIQISEIKLPFPQYYSALFEWLAKKNCCFVVGSWGIKGFCGFIHD